MIYIHACGPILPVLLGSHVITCTHCALYFRLLGGKDTFSFVYSIGDI